MRRRSAPGADCPICRGTGQIDYYDGYRGCYCASGSTPAEVVALQTRLRARRQADLIASTRISVAQREWAHFVVEHATRVIDAIGATACSSCGASLGWAELETGQCATCAGHSG